MFAFCPSCYPGRPIVIKEQLNSEGQRAVFVGFLRDEDRPSGIIPAQSMSQVNELVPKAAIAKYSKIDFGE